MASFSAMSHLQTPWYALDPLRLTCPLQFLTPLTGRCNASEESTHDLDPCFTNAQSPLSFNHTVLRRLWRNSADSMSFVLFCFFSVWPHHHYLAGLCEHKNCSFCLSVWGHCHHQAGNAPAVMVCENKGVFINREFLLVAGLSRTRRDYLPTIKMWMLYLALFCL